MAWVKCFMEQCETPISLICTSPQTLVPKHPPIDTAIELPLMTFLQGP